MLVASALYLTDLGDVRSPIWDEAYYFTSTARYHEGRAQFASHPPLGLMLIAAGDSLLGNNAAVDLSRLAELESVRQEQMPPGFDYAGPRYASAIFGILAAGMFFLLMLELTGSSIVATLLAPLWLFDGLVIAQVRAAQLDAFQLAFALAALFFALRSIRRQRWQEILAFAFFATCAVLVRANAALLVVCVPFLLAGALAKRNWTRVSRQCLAGLAGFSIAILSVSAIYAATTHELPNVEVPPGSKHDRFVSAAHRDAIVTGDWPARAVVSIWSDQWKFIAADASGIPREDANGSHPWDWLWGDGAITYLWGASDDKAWVISVIPNRPAWWLSLFGVIVAGLALARSFEPRSAMLLVFWLANMGALLLLDRDRVMYSYHYLLPLVAGYGLLALVLRKYGVPQFAAWTGVALVTMWGALTLPLAVNYPVSLSYCQFFLTDCGQSEGATAFRLRDETVSKL